MNMFELFKYGSEVIVKLIKDGLQVKFKLTKLRSALIEHFSIHKNSKLYIETIGQLARNFETCKRYTTILYSVVRFQMYHYSSTLPKKK